MKKFVTLIVVLGMVSVANAAPVLTIGGTPVSPTTPAEITLTTSGTIELDIEIDPGFIGGDLQILITPQASLNATGVWLNPEYYFMGMAPLAWDYAFSVYTSTLTDFTFGGGNMSNANSDTRTLMDGLILHCDEATDVVVQLIAFSMIDYDGISGDDVPMGTLLGQINIDQIPEPATLVLLGLGGLLLRRRK